MHLDIKTTNLELTPSIKEYIETKVFPLSKFVKKWEKTGAVEAKFELARTTNHHHKGEIFYAEINIVLGGKLLRAKHSGEDAHKVIDKVKDIIKKEMIELKKQSDIKHV